MNQKDKLEVPRFGSEAEEAQWWFDHRDETAGLMENAVAEGRTSSLDMILENKRNGGEYPHGLYSNRPGRFGAGTGSG